ncbi:MAG TPA: hypothetical protein VFB48_01055, partial [Nitrososphaeraceae archaeon]|nr:hypothetical protein [Nitrososphaeraceae archaeon]
PFLLTLTCSATSLGTDGPTSMVGSYRKVSVLRISINKKVCYFPTINYLGYHGNSSIIQM